MFGRPANVGGSGRPVCKFFLEGRCKFGDNCKNEHPRNQASQQQLNRFAPLQNNGDTGFRNRQGAVGSSQASNPFSVSEDAIRDDLTSGKERPQWPLSAYGPGVKAPRQLLEGAVEVSPEEMRVLCYAAQAAGNPQEYVQHEERMLQQVNQQIQTIVNDLPGAKKYIIDGQNQHPNRNDIVNNPAGNHPAQSSNTQTNAGFGSNQSAFGTPSALGASQPGFGSSSALGAPSAFGAPSALGRTPAFGASSALGQTSGFGRGSAPGGGAGSFGKPSPFGQPSTLGQTPTPFGGGQTTSPFAQSGILTPPSAFGVPSQQPQQSTGFGQPTALGSTAPRSSPFAQMASNQSSNSPFAQAAATTTPQNNPFAQPSQPQSQAPNAFAQAGQATNQIQSPFAAAPTATTPQPNRGFGIPAAAPSPFASSNTVRPGFGSTSANHMQTLGSQNRQVVTDEEGKSFYEVPAPTPNNPNNKRRERIWHPNGPPQSVIPEAEGPAEAYTGDLGAVLQEIYATVKDSGEFKLHGGVMPEIPPKREWIDWDL